MTTSADSIFVVSYLKIFALSNQSQSAAFFASQLPMDTSSPVYAHAAEYFLQDFAYDTYPQDNAVISVDSIPNADRLNFVGLNSLQLSGAPHPSAYSYSYQTPAPATPAYHQALRQGPVAYHSDIDERDSPIPAAISPPMTNMTASDVDLHVAPIYHGAGTPAHSTGTSSPASSHGGHVPLPAGLQQQQQQQVQQSPVAMAAPQQQSPQSQHRQQSPSLVHRHVRSTRAAASSAAASSAVVRDRRKAARRSSTSNIDDDFDSDNDVDEPPMAESASKRREDVRRQRIESEQRRRDELRDGYRKLKDVLPVSNQKSSKVSLLDRAVSHINNLEMAQGSMVMKINELEAETARLRHALACLSFPFPTHYHLRPPAQSSSSTLALDVDPLVSTPSPSASALDLDPSPFVIRERSTAAARAACLRACGEFSPADACGLHFGPSSSD
ncbi:hypothetical protein DL93DRAFT_2162514 [Clavulina sp. PMI_390]|nr:hypothetical protein DL93DRAFT_2162514 [Clavulina sp. PMI_390]